MKQRTKDAATKWLETAKKMDTFTVEGTPHSKTEIEELLGIKPKQKMEKQINKDIEEKSYGDVEQTFDSGDTEES